MGLFTDIYNTVAKFFRQSDEPVAGDASKAVATNRLKLVLMQDRTNLTPKVLEQMRGELVDLLSKYLEMDKDLLELNFEQEGDQVALMLSIPVIRAKDEEEIEKALAAEAESAEDDEDIESEEKSFPEATWTYEIDGDYEEGFATEEECREAVKKITWSQFVNSDEFDRNDWNFDQYPEAAEFVDNEDFEDCVPDEFDPDDYYSEIYVYQDFNSLNQHELAEYLADIFEETYRYEYQYYKRFAGDIEYWIDDNYDFPEYQKPDIESACFDIAWDMVEILEERCDIESSDDDDEEYDDDEYDDEEYDDDEEDYDESLKVEEATSHNHSQLSDEVETIIYNAVKDAFEVGHADPEMWKSILEDLEGLEFDKELAYKYFMGLLNDGPGQFNFEPEYDYDDDQYDFDDDVEQDRMHAALYGGDRTYCDKCGAKLIRDEWGGSCPNCDAEQIERDRQNTLIDDDMNYQIDEVFARRSDIDLDGVGHQIRTLLRVDEDDNGNWIDFDTTEETSVMGSNERTIGFYAVGETKEIKGSITTKGDRLHVQIKNGSEGIFNDENEIADFIKGEFGIA